MSHEKNFFLPTNSHRRDVPPAMNSSVIGTVNNTNLALTSCIPVVIGYSPMPDATNRATIGMPTTAAIGADFLLDRLATTPVSNPTRGTKMKPRKPRG